MDDQWFAIANPTAGKGLVRKEWPALQERIRRQLPVAEFRLTEYRGHAIELVRQAIEKGYRKVLAIGGDGTNHEATNGILQQQAAPSQSITYALLPIGTGNDWIKTYRLSRNIDKALAVIKAGNTRLQDAGLIRYHKNGQAQERYFVNVAGLAYDGYLVRRSDDASERGGKLFYLLLILRCLFEYHLRRARVIADGQVYEDEFYTINLGIGRFSGGGMQLVPHAIPDDGQFAVTIAGRLSKIGVLLNTYRFYNGSIGGHPKVEAFFAKNLRVEAADGEPPTLLEADGEFLGETPAEFSLVEKALKVIVP